MAKFKVGDKVKIIGNASGSRNGIGDTGTVIELNGIGYRVSTSAHPDGNACWSYDYDLKLINQNNMDEFKITKERILAAAAKCSTAKATLETMFPEAFDDVNDVVLHIDSDGCVRDQNDRIALDFSHFGKSGSATLREQIFNYKIEGGMLKVTRKK